MRILSIAVPIGAFAILFAACASETPVEREAASVSNLQPEGPAGVSARITVARCAREQTCGHVGAGKTYASLGECQDKLLQPTKAEVGACLEYDGWMLDQCTTDIHRSRCKDPLYTVGSITTCNMRRLCHKPDSPNDYAP